MKEIGSKLSNIFDDLANRFGFEISNMEVIKDDFYELFSSLENMSLLLDRRNFEEIVNYANIRENVFVLINEINTFLTILENFNSFKKDMKDIMFLARSLLVYESKHIDEILKKWDVIDDEEYE